MIELRNTVKKFESNDILRGINLQIPKGSAFGLLGSNGVNYTASFVGNLQT